MARPRWKPSARSGRTCMLCDVMMPRLDGFGTAACAARRDAATQNLPVMLLSARAGEEARIEGLDAGADDYLVKPFSARELLARVGALLERSRVLANIAYRNAQFETLIGRAPLGIYLVDADFRISEVNPTARAVFGEALEVIGRDFGEVMRLLWPQQYAEEMVHLFQRTLQTGEPYFTSERRVRRREGDVVEYYEWQINRIRLSDGRYGVVCYFRDVTNHVAARKALLQQQQELESADRQKNEFLAMLAHELRNPARTHPQLRPGAGPHGARRFARGEGRGKHRAPGYPSGAPGRRPAGRFQNHAGPH